MKYFQTSLTLLIIFLCGCVAKIDIGNSYNRTLKSGKFVEYTKKDLKEIIYLEFASRVSDKEINEIFFTIEQFSQNHQEIASLRIVLDKKEDDEITKKEIEELAKKLGAEYVLAYKMKDIFAVSTSGDRRAFAYSDDRKIYYLVHFFVSKND
jgi:hypothetical protein